MKRGGQIRFGHFASDRQTFSSETAFSLFGVFDALDAHTIHMKRLFTRRESLKQITVNAAAVRAVRSRLIFTFSSKVFNSVKVVYTRVFIIEFAVFLIYLPINKIENARSVSNGVHCEIEFVFSNFIKRPISFCVGRRV